MFPWQAADLRQMLELEVNLTFGARHEVPDVLAILEVVPVTPVMSSVQVQVLLFVGLCQTIATNIPTVAFDTPFCLL